MIYVNKDQVKQVEYLIGQSIQGHHILFDSTELRDVFATSTAESSPKAEESLEQLIALPTIAQKRAFLERMPKALYQQVTRIYFNIVENNLIQDNPTRH